MPGVNLRQYDCRLLGASVDESLESLVDLVLGKDPDFTLDLNPDYQRGPAWERSHQSLFMGSFLSRSLVPPLYFYRDDSFQDTRMEVVDGQQRLRAMVAFVQGEVPATIHHRGEDVTLWYRDFAVRDKRHLTYKVIYGDWPRLERLRFYRSINHQGVPHSMEELQKVDRLIAKEEALSKP